MEDLHELETLLKSPMPLIVVETHEESRVIDLFQRLVRRLPTLLYKWTVTEGLQRLDVDMPPQRHNSKTAELLSQIKVTKIPGIYLLLDFHPFLDDPVTVRMLKDIAQFNEGGGHTIVIVSHDVPIPEELKSYTALFELSMPTRQRLHDIVREEASRWSSQNKNARVKSDQRTLDLLVEHLRGLPQIDVRRLVRKAIENDGALNGKDLQKIMDKKFELLSQDGVLSFEYETAAFAEVGGLAALKRWLLIRKKVFTDAAPPKGLDRPKGVMLLGVQGGGKSLAAKAVAGNWGVPLLRLDFGTLYNKFYGETERNLRDALKTAEVMSPCVLWIDEIEKGISTNDNDSGTSRRVLGTLLTWMAENEQRVFIVATANDIESLPPELIRKGRLDEIFFVDLPDRKTRSEIFRIHLHKRDLDGSAMDTELLAEESKGFAGAGIEQAVVSALYSAHAEGAPLTSQHLVTELKRTRPISVVMAEKIQALRSWAQGRTVSAN